MSDELMLSEYQVRYIMIHEASRAAAEAVGYMVPFPFGRRETQEETDRRLRAIEAGIHEAMRVLEARLRRWGPWHIPSPEKARAFVRDWRASQRHSFKRSEAVCSPSWNRLAEGLHVDWREWVASVREKAVHDQMTGDELRELVAGLALCAEAVEAMNDVVGLCPVCDIYGDHAAGCKVGEAKDWLLTAGMGSAREGGVE